MTRYTQVCGNMVLFSNPMSFARYSSGMITANAPLCEVAFGVGLCTAGAPDQMWTLTSATGRAVALGVNPPNRCILSGRISSGLMTFMVFVTATFNITPYANINFCSFPGLGGTTCQIRGVDGLPVELLDFYIDDSGDSQSEGSPEREGSTSGEGALTRP